VLKGRDWQTELLGIILLVSRLFLLEWLISSSLKSSRANHPEIQSLSASAFSLSRRQTNRNIFLGNLPLAFSPFFQLRTPKPVYSEEAIAADKDEKERKVRRKAREMEEKGEKDVGKNQEEEEDDGAESDGSGGSFM